MLRKLADVMVRPLEILFERSWRFGEVPEDWKTANGNPLLKQGKKEDAGSCQPVSHYTPIDKLSKCGLDDKQKMR